MLQIEDLSFKYYNTGKEAVRNVSFGIPRGKVTALLGPSGCGKTTILNLVAGIISEKDGEVGGRIVFIEDGARPAVVFQKPTLLPWRSIRENVLLPSDIRGISQKEAGAEADRLLLEMGLGESSGLLPHEISLGMQQRANFARALVAHPHLVLMDEPFSALDTPTRHGIQREFLTEVKKRGITALLITHNPEEAFYMADQIVVMSGSPGVVKKAILNDKVGMLSEQRVGEHGIY